MIRQNRTALSTKKIPQKRTKQAEKYYKRSKSKIETKPARIYEENTFEELVNKRKSHMGSSHFMRSTTTIESERNNLSNSPRESLTNPKSGDFKRRSTLPLKAFDNLIEQHPISSRKDFEEAVSCVFEKDIANKSLGRKSRVNEDILLDNHAFKRSNTSHECGS